MTDIVERLREVAVITTGLLYSRRKMLNDAADEIEMLRHEAVKRLKTLTDANDNSARYCAELASMEQDIESLRARAEKAEAERQQSSREWRKAFDAMHQRAMKAEATCEKLAAALSAAEEVVNVAEQMTSSRSDDDWIWGVQAKIKAALSEYRKEASE
jgi:DNA repair exonuclease SbcCD ATPase subunit